MFSIFNFESVPNHGGVDGEPESHMLEKYTWSFRVEKEYFELEEGAYQEINSPLVALTIL